MKVLLLGSCCMAFWNKVFGFISWEGVLKIYGKIYETMTGPGSRLNWVEKQDRATFSERTIDVGV